MNSFSIDKQRDKVNAEWMSRPVDDRKPLGLVLISMAQSLTFAYRLKRKLLNGPNFGGAYTIIYTIYERPVDSLIGLSIIVIGVLLYLIDKKINPNVNLSN